ncbi:uncharacterized protein ACA1_041970 [Acanthamoeba castellanii str. Neff]|uniref:Uncharacterized protein n=1 Tax=Acanthamoeba castellanii (strain ATCC 30010 / Neff) TaxID=1257118 RepID=L8GV27_ACACF|nr:uncharacterized protein ACA1_041970 [Acanthamoeba castellanii str. Neff]ELR16860.1 hypothetical protein ACA1_041970 [Acanthamoeba castellanii str. Neff]
MSYGLDKKAAASSNLWALPHHLQQKREVEERLSLLISGGAHARPGHATSALNDACCTQSFFLLLFLCLTLGVALAIAGYKHFSAEVSAHHSFVPAQCLVLAKASHPVEDCFRGVCEEGYVVQFQVEYVHRHQGRMQASAYEKVTRPRHTADDARRLLDAVALNATRPCFHHRKEAHEVVLGVDYDASFVVSLVLWILVVLYVLGVSAGAFIYVVTKKAKARSRSRRKRHDIEDDDHDENVCEEDPIFLIYDYGTFDPRSARKSPRPAPLHDWT